MKLKLIITLNKMTSNYIFKHETDNITIKIPKSDVSWGSNIEWDTGDSSYQNSVGEMPKNISCWIKSYQFNMGGWGWKLMD